MRNLYKYTGNISRFTFQRTTKKVDYPVMDMVLKEPYHDEKAPVRLGAYGGLAEYINTIVGTDAEECYILSDWYYDSLLRLYRIVVPSRDPNIPAKIITQLDPLDREVVIFGPADYIQTADPEPMDREQFSSWREFRCKSMDKTGWR